jgi:hypothetical protein
MDIDEQFLERRLNPAFQAAAVFPGLSPQVVDLRL